MREVLLLAASTLATLLLGLVVVRLAAPELLGGPPDLRIVRASEQVVPFFENALGTPEGDALVLNDPYTLVRLRPLLSADEHSAGPTDLLGFRNRGIPNRSDVIVIGDSQTYGINVAYEESWPYRLAAALAPDAARVYGISTGGWGAVQYLDLFEKSLVFEPRVLVVAFYSGNDAAESFRLAYGVERWADLRPDASLGLDDRPVLSAEEQKRGYAVQLPGRKPVSFTPWRRLRAMARTPVNDAGWEIMAEAARRMARLAANHDAEVLFTIIPTKELAYARTIVRQGGVIHPDHFALVEVERVRIARLAQVLAEVGSYVDVTAPLEQAVARGVDTHPASVQGHPSPAGYRLLAELLTTPVRAALAR